MMADSFSFLSKVQRFTVPRSGFWVQGFIPIRKVIFKDTIPAIGVFRNLNFQAPNAKEIPNANIQ